MDTAKEPRLIKDVPIWPHDVVEPGARLFAA